MAISHLMACLLINDFTTTDMFLSSNPRFQRYGDIPDKEGAGGATADTTSPAAREWPLWEVFIRSKAGLDHKHVGSLHAADAEMAIENARDVYTRRLEGVSIWVVESRYVHASNPDDQGAFYEPANDKVYRHPTFYTIPEEITHM